MLVPSVRAEWVGAKAHCTKTRDQDDGDRVRRANPPGTNGVSGWCGFEMKASRGKVAGGTEPRGGWYSTPHVARRPPGGRSAPDRPIPSPSSPLRSPAAARNQLNKPKRRASATLAKSPSARRRRLRVALTSADGRRDGLRATRHATPTASPDAQTHPQDAAAQFNASPAGSTRRRYNGRHRRLGTG